MITQSILNFVAAMIASMLGLIPSLSPDVQEAVESIPEKANEILAYAGRLSPILPVNQINAAVGIVVAGAALAIAIRLVMKTLSLATGGGGR